MYSQRISINSSYDDIHLLVPWLHKLAEDAGLSTYASMQLELAVIEAVNNAVEHAYKLQSGHTVELLASHDGDSFTVEICDTGLGLDQARLEKIKAEKDQEEAIAMTLMEESGRGLRLITQLADKVDYISDGEKNRMVLVKRVDAGE